MINDVRPSGTHTRALYGAVEVSTKRGVVGISAPDPVNRVRTHTLSSDDTKGLVAQIVQARSEETDRVLLTYEGVIKDSGWLVGGSRRFWTIAVVMCDPASREVGRWAKVAKTDRMDARRIVRALEAWDRLAPTRTRITNRIRGLFR